MVTVEDAAGPSGEVAFNLHWVIMTMWAITARRDSYDQRGRRFPPSSAWDMHSSAIDSDCLVYKHIYTDGRARCYVLCSNGGVCCYL